MFFSLFLLILFSFSLMIATISLNRFSAVLPLIFSANDLPIKKPPVFIKELFALNTYWEYNTKTTASQQHFYITSLCYHFDVPIAYHNVHTMSICFNTKRIALCNFFYNRAHRSLQLFRTVRNLFI